MPVAPRHRTAGNHPSRRLGLRSLALAVLATAALALPGAGDLATAPASAATASLTLQGTLNHTLSGIYPGNSPGRAFSSPAFADITGDSAPEIVVASMDGRVEAFRATDRGRIWSVSLGNTAIQASPTIADLGGDGKPDVVVATMDGRVVWLDGPTGRVVRTFRQGANLHCPASNPNCRPRGFFASPAVADINGDRILDIVAPSYDHTVYAWSRTGGLLWRKYVEDTVWSSPVIADIDRDNKPEIIFGGDIWAGNPLRKPKGGLIWVLRGTNGATYPGYPRSTPNQTVWSSPAVADLNRDGFPDIVVGTGTYWPEPNGRRVDAFTAKTGGNLPGWPVSVDSRVMSSPAIGDIDDDGALEVTFASTGGYVYAYEANGSRKWVKCNALTTSSCGGSTSTSAGTIIADVDADGVQEVISTLDKDLRIFDGRNGALEDQYRMSHPATWTGGSTPAVAEVNGKATIVQSSTFRSNGHGGGLLKGDITKVYVFTTGTGLCRADWPQFHRDARRTGVYRGTHDVWRPFKCPADFVRQQYRDFLGRTPDASGTSYWTSRLHKGTTGSSLIRSFIGSNEFGRVVSPVMRSYLSVHGTYPPTRALIDDGVASFRQGATPAALADLYASSAPIAELTDQQFVTRVYNNVYKRNPSGAELSTEVAKLAEGTTRGTLASSHAESSIGQSRLSTEVTVAMVYLGMLGRAPDPSGWAYWVPKARATNTDTLVQGFQSSNEYARRVGS